MTKAQAERQYKQARAEYREAGQTLASSQGKMRILASKDYKAARKWYHTAGAVLFRITG